jgi:hypothetical protein
MLAMDQRAEASLQVGGGDQEAVYWMPLLAKMPDSLSWSAQVYQGAIASSIVNYLYQGETGRTYHRYELILGIVVFRQVPPPD